MDALVAGAGGFIGGHMVEALVRDGKSVRAVDIKPLSDWFQRFPEAENVQLDLRLAPATAAAVRDCRSVYNFASDMGGMGFIESNKALCMLSVLINTHLLLASRDAGVERYFFASSACVYPVGRQDTEEVQPLSESEAYPAMPEDGYGWEKLFGERMCRHFSEDFGVATRVARYHNIYGPHGAWRGGREKAPAAICRKVAQAKASGSHEIEIWGDGEQRRSFTFIDDCVTGTRRLMDSDVAQPLNIGSDETVSINQLVDIVERISGVRLRRIYRRDAPQGVRGRTSDNSLITELLGWAPSVRLQDGLEQTYRWIANEVARG